MRLSSGITPNDPTGRLTGAPPAQAYAALPKATPNTTHETEYRTRTDRVDRNGKVTLRYASKIRYLGIDSAHRGEQVLMLIHNQHVTTSDAATDEILTELRLDATKDYQPPTWCKPLTERTHEKHRERQKLQK